MTLVIGMSKADGAYMSTDYRVTRAGVHVDDEEVKLLVVSYPPSEGGPRALFGYTGLAELRDGTRMGRWLQETMRDQGTFDASMEHLRTRLDRDIAPEREPLMINILVVHGDRRYLAALSNARTKVTAGGKIATHREFRYRCDELDRPVVFANGLGASRLVSGGHLDRLRGQMGIRPRRAMDHMNLLATTNRRVAAKDNTVSPFCHVTFVPADGGPTTSRTFLDRGESAPIEAPYIFCGVDLTLMQTDVVRRLEALRRDEPPPPDLDAATMNEALRPRP